MKTQWQTGSHHPVQTQWAAWRALHLECPRGRGSYCVGHAYETSLKPQGILLWLQFLLFSSNPQFRKPQCCLGCLKYLKPHIAVENMPPWLMSSFSLETRLGGCVCVCRYTADNTRKHSTYHGCGCFLDLFFHEHVGLVTDQLWIRGLAPITCQSQDLTNNKCQQDWIDKSAVWTEPVGRKSWAGTLGGTRCPLTKVHFYYKSGTEWV